MNSPLRKTFILCSCLFFPLISEKYFPQTDPVLQRYRNDEQGNIMYRKESVLQKNLVRTLFQNNGEIGHWPYSPSCEWPKGSGVDNTDGMSVLVSSEVTLPGGSVIHPLETSYREWMDKDPLTGEIWGFEPIPGYSSERSIHPAIASDPNSWPEKWPAALGLSSDWDGHFYSYFGKIVRPEIDETFYVIDDSKDGEWKRTPYNFFPIKSDSSRGGLGLRLEVRAIQADYLSVKDVIFWNYDVINISDLNYQKSYFGMYVDVGCGGFNSGADNAEYIKNSSLVYTWDTKGQLPNGKSIGYTGYSFLGTSGDSAQKGLTALSIYILGDGGVGGGWPKDDESMWLKMSSGKFDTQIQDKNISMVLASGPFPLLQGKKTKAATALIFGKDLPEIILNKNIAEQVYDNNYIFSDTLRFPGSIASAITSPAKGNSVSGTTEITWTSSGNYGKTSAAVYYTNDDRNYSLIAVDSSNSGKLSWNTSSLGDGIFYKLRLMLAAENGMGFSESDYFTINNPGNTPPQIKITNPLKNYSLSGTINIRWIAGDADNDPYYINLYYRAGNNLNWLPVALNIKQTDAAFQWDTRKFANSKNASLMAQVISLTDTGMAIVEPIEIINERNVYSGSEYVTQRHTLGTGTVSLVAVNPSEITGHDYIIQFDSLYNLHKLVYNVIDKSTGKTVLNNVQEMSSDMEGPYFDGLRLIMLADSIDLNYKSTGWTTGSSNLTMTVSASNNKQFGFRFPYDYQIDFFGTKQIPSYDGNIPGDGPRVNFIIKNLTKNDTSAVLVIDNNQDGQLSVGDDFYIVEFIDKNKNGIKEVSERKYNWAITYRVIPGETPIEPKAGDKFLIATTKPFLKGDSLIISTSKLTDVTDDKRIQKDYFLSQNYPNPFNPATRIDFVVAEQGMVTIKIFDAVGRGIKTLANREFNAGRYSITWDGRTDNGSILSSGIYYYQIQASGFISTKKMILLK